MNDLKFLKTSETANRLGLIQPAVSDAAIRGEEIAKQKGYSLLNK